MGISASFILVFYVNRITGDLQAVVMSVFLGQSDLCAWQSSASISDKLPECVTSSVVVTKLRFNCLHTLEWSCCLFQKEKHVRGLSRSYLFGFKLVVVLGRLPLCKTKAVFNVYFTLMFGSTDTLIKRMALRHHWAQRLYCREAQMQPYLEKLSHSTFEREY